MDTETCSLCLTIHANVYMMTVMTDGRWTGRYWEWTCEGCGCVLCSTEVPRSTDESRCLGCRSEDAIGFALRQIREIARENERLRADARKLEKQHLEDCDRIFELEQQLAERGAA